MALDPSPGAAEASTIQSLEAILAEGEAGSEEARDEATAEATPEPTPHEREAEDATSEPDESADEAVKAKKAGEKADTDDVEVPETIGAWAEELGVDAEALAAHVKVQVKVDGAVRDVPLSDVVKNYQLEGHWQRKDMALADERRAFDDARQAFNAEYQRTSQVLHALAQQAEHLIAGEMQALNPELEKDDPIEYARQERAIRQRREYLNQLYGGIGNVLQYAQGQQFQQHEALREFHARNLAEKVPEWGSDPYKAQREIGELRALARGAGFSQAETDNLIDHRTILLLRELKQLREQKAGVPLARKKLKTLPKIKLTRPGAGQGAGGDRAATTKVALKKLRQTGDWRDGADALMGLGIV